MTAWHNAVYDVLVEECGAIDSEDNRQQFASSWPACREYRFMGHLGFGGKVWDGRYASKFPHVSCYTEDATPERRAMIDRANARLKAL